MPQREALSVLPARALVRAHEWWFHKLPHCVFVYFLASEATTLWQAIPPLGALLATVSAVANYGNAINELSDRDEDAKVGRQNVANQLGPAIVGSIAVVSAVLALTLAYVSGGLVATVLTAIALALPTLYSIPPIRLKERMLLGVAADALAAHVFPALLALILALSPERLAGAPGFTTAVIVWALMTGLRGILTHQVDTADRDRAAGLATIVHVAGVEIVTRLILLLILPLEIASLAAACVFAPTGLAFLAVVVLYVWTAWAKTLAREPSASRGDLAQSLPLFDNAFYLAWAPVGIVMDRSFDAPELAALVPLVALLFWRNIRHESFVLEGVARRLRSSAASVVGGQAVAESIAVAAPIAATDVEIPSAVPAAPAIDASSSTGDVNEESELGRTSDIGDADANVAECGTEVHREEELASGVLAVEASARSAMTCPDDLDPDYYVTRYPDIKAAGVDPVKRWIEWGRGEGRVGRMPAVEPRPAPPDHLDPESHLARHPDVDADEGAPVELGIEGDQEQEPTGGEPAQVAPSLAQPDDLDLEYYLTRYPDVTAAGVDPVEHWIKWGRAEGRIGREPALPEDLDPEYYLARYPDVKRAGVDPVRHWLETGRAEGRTGRASSIVTGSASYIDPSKPTLVVVSHEASRTGAPILALNLVDKLKERYNIISVLLGGGPLVDAFVERSQLSLRCLAPYPADAMGLARQAIELAQPDFALVNCAVSWPVLSEFAAAHVPTVMLVHEFLTSMNPAQAIDEIIHGSSEIVFSSPIILEDAKRACPGWSPQQNTHILPQGRCSLFPDSSATLDKETSFLDRIPASTRLVVGMGTVEFRKGVDLFIQCAQRIRSALPRPDVQFVWVGRGFNPEIDKAYSVYLQEQIERGGLGDVVSVTGELSDLEAVYERADLLLLTSRLDPLPNIGIDAITTGLPLLCFAQASGIASVLVEEGLAETCVAPYADAAMMADLAAEILADEDQARELAERLKEIGRRRFDLDTYVGAITQLLERARPASAHLEREQASGERGQSAADAAAGLSMDDGRSAGGPAAEQPCTDRAVQQRVVTRGSVHGVSEYR